MKIRISLKAGLFALGLLASLAWGAYSMRSGLDKADKLSSVLAAASGLVLLPLTVWSLFGTQPERPPNRAPSLSAGSVSIGRDSSGPVVTGDQNVVIHQNPPRDA